MRKIRFKVLAEELNEVKPAIWCADSTGWCNPYRWPRGIGPI